LLQLWFHISQHNSRETHLQVRQIVELGSLASERI